MADIINYTKPVACKVIEYGLEGGDMHGVEHGEARESEAVSAGSNGFDLKGKSK